MDFVVFLPYPQPILVIFFKDSADLNDWGIEMDFVVFYPIPSPYLLSIYKDLVGLNG